MNEVAKVENNQVTPKTEIVGRIIAIIVFVLVWAALGIAIISDIIVFSKQLILFVVAVLGAAIVFVIGFVLVMISCILIFGVYLLETYGFWPADWAVQAFHEILQDAPVTSDQMIAMIIIRGILILLCVVAFCGAIAALVLRGIARKKNKQRRQGLTISFSIITLIFSTLGVFTATVVIIILAIIASAT